MLHGRNPRNRKAIIRSDPTKAQILLPSQDRRISFAGSTRPCRDLGLGSFFHGDGKSNTTVCAPSRAGNSTQAAITFWRRRDFKPIPPFCSRVQNFNWARSSLMPRTERDQTLASKSLHRIECETRHELARALASAVNEVSGCLSPGHLLKRNGTRLNACATPGMHIGSTSGTTAAVIQPSASRQSIRRHHLSSVLTRLPLLDL